MALIRTLDVDTQNAIRDRNVIVPRDFIVFRAKTRDTGDESLRCFWNEPETVTTNVLELGGDVVSHTFSGGAIQKMDSIPQRIGIEVRTIQIELSALDNEVKNLIRGDDPRGAVVEIYRGYLSPVSFLLVANPRLRFLGKVNGAPITTPSVGGTAKVVIKVISHTRELTFINGAVKSDFEQKKRSGDKFRRYAGRVKSWPIYWGIKK